MRRCVFATIAATPSFVPSSASSSAPPRAWFPGHFVRGKDFGDDHILTDKGILVAPIFGHRRRQVRCERIVRLGDCRCNLQLQACALYHHEPKLFVCRVP